MTEISENGRKNTFGADLPGKPFLRIDEVATAIGLSDSFVRKLLDCGALEGHRHNGGSGKISRWRISRDAVVLYLIRTADYEPDAVVERIMEILKRRSREEIEAVISNSQKLLKDS